MHARMAKLKQLWTRTLDLSVGEPGLVSPAVLHALACADPWWCGWLLLGGVVCTYGVALFCDPGLG